MCESCSQKRVKVAVAIRPERQPTGYGLQTEGGEGVGVGDIEIKATNAPDASDARHLLWLRDELDSQFVAGAVLHVGSRKYRLSDRIEAIPICALWA